MKTLSMKSLQILNICVRIGDISLNKSRYLYKNNEDGELLDSGKRSVQHGQAGWKNVFWFLVIPSNIAT